MAPFQISLIVPAFNEADNLTRAVQSMQSALLDLKINGEIVLVDDGSTDHTSALVATLASQNTNILAVHNQKNMGIGYSFWNGASKAKGDVVVMLPGDGENDPKEILRYLPLMEQVDIVVPYVYNIETRSLYRRILSKVFKAIINLSFGMLLNYMNGTVMYRRTALKSLSLNSAGFFYQTELLIKAIRRGYLYAEVPYAIQYRSSGKSKAVSLKSFIRVAKDYSRTIYSVYIERNAPMFHFPGDTATAKRKMFFKNSV